MRPDEHAELPTEGELDRKLTAIERRYLERFRDDPVMVRKILRGEIPENRRSADGRLQSWYGYLPTWRDHEWWLDRKRWNPWSADNIAVTVGVLFVILLFARKAIWG